MALSRDGSHGGILEKEMGTIDELATINLEPPAILPFLEALEACFPKICSLEIEVSHYTKPCRSEEEEGERKKCWSVSLFPQAAISRRGSHWGKHYLASGSLTRHLGAKPGTAG